MDAKQAALLEAYWQYHRHHGMTEDGRKKMHATVNKLVAEGDKFLPSSPRRSGLSWCRQTRMMNLPACR